MRKNGLRNLPTMEQPYEKCLENGPESLSDAELLAVILRCGARGKTSLELAREILSLPGKEEGLLGLYHCTRQDLLQIRGHSFGKLTDALELDRFYFPDSADLQKFLSCTVIES